MKRLSCYTCDRCQTVITDFAKMFVTNTRKYSMLHYCSSVCYLKHNADARKLITETISEQQIKRSLHNEWH